MNKIIVKTLFGLEQILAEELKSLGAEDIEIGNRSISCNGTDELIYRINLHSRLSLRVLKVIDTAFIKNESQLYDFAKSIKWEKIFKKNYTFAVDSTVHSDNFNHTNYVALKTKDAICDYLRSKWNFRPDIDKENPDILIHTHINKNECSILLDSSGNSLHKRGWRIYQNDAPLNEVLAAGMIEFSQWKPEDIFIDGMCGSATILMEAVSKAINYPPGLKRTFSFQNWVDFDNLQFDKIITDAKNNINRKSIPKIIGIDNSLKAINISKQNIQNAGFEKYIELKKMNFFKFDNVFSSGTVMLNPPYGERFGTEEDLINLYKEIGNKLKFDFAGFNAWIISSNFEALKYIGLKPNKKIKLFNGSLECRFNKYELFSGKLKDNKSL